MIEKDTARRKPILPRRRKILRIKVGDRIKRSELAAISDSTFLTTRARSDSEYTFSPISGDNNHVLACKKDPGTEGNADCTVIPIEDIPKYIGLRRN